MKKRAFPIRIKVLLAVLVMLMLAVGIITATMANLFQQDKTAYVRDFSVAVAGNMQSEIDVVLKGHLSATSVLAEVLFADYLDPGAKQLLAKPIFAAYPGLLALVTTSTEGNPVSLANTTAMRDADIEASEILAYSSIIDSLGAGDVEVRRADFANGASAISLTVGHVLEDSGTTMPVVSIVNAQSVSQALERGKPFDAVLVDVDGLPVLASKDFMTTGGSAKPVLMGNDTVGSSGAFEYTEGGDNFIAGFSKTSLGELEVITQISASAAYLTARQLLDELIFVGLVLILLAAIGGVIVSRRITRPLERLSAAVQSVAKGNFNVSVAIKSGDEIGELSTSFNDMADELTERDESLKKAQYALIQSEKMAAVGTLSAGLAHEVKNPLSAVLGYAQLSKRKLSQPDALKKHLDTIEHETRRCTDIIGNLMQFSRAEKGEHTEISVNEVVSKSISIVDHQLALQDVTIESNLAENLPPISGNANQLQQVLMNLMINAQQAIGEQGGTVTVTTSADPESLLIAVADTGPGMDPDVAEKVFEPFFTTKPAGEGTGLGLSVTYGIINDHGGDISVTRADSGGALFVITLPYMNEGAVAMERAS